MCKELEKERELEKEQELEKEPSYMRSHLTSGAVLHQELSYNRSYPTSEKSDPVSGKPDTMRVESQNFRRRLEFTQEDTDTWVLPSMILQPTEPDTKVLESQDQGTPDTKNKELMTNQPQENRIPDTWEVENRTPDTKVQTPDTWEV